MNEIPYALLVGFIAFLGLYLSNIFLDYGAPQYISRKCGHFFGGVSYLLSAFLFSSPWWPIAISFVFVVILGGARLLRPATFRGVGGSARQSAYAEVYFPLMGTIALGVGWAWLGNPWLAIVPILYMSWGDMVTGLIRSAVYHKEIKGNWGSLGMLLVCLIVACLFTPYWVAAVGAVVATLTERFTPLSRWWIDDNFTIIALSLLAMSLLI